MSTEQVFSDIYAKNKWGGKSGTFSSGVGSVSDKIVSPYVSEIRRWMSSIGADHMTVVDLGCGDFRVGRQLTNSCKRYIGVDIVEALVEHNASVFGNSHVEFRHLNIIKNALPKGDVCFVRQVLQHLSNEQISAILPKLEKYQWVVVTESQPLIESLPNIDKCHGGDIRLFQNSGVYLEHPPFSIPRERMQLLLEVEEINNGLDLPRGVIRTFIINNAKREL